ncbi:hypothetical protein Q6284_33810, partial [Klebsiella pneumoniae]|nr:hypothetical protein [Klebsiella pneumoniae]
ADIRPCRSGPPSPGTLRAERAWRISQKVKGLARAFRRNLIVGDSTTNNKAFDGIPKLMHDDQKIDISGASMTFSMFDEL